MLPTSYTSGLRLHLLLRRPLVIGTLRASVPMPAPSFIFSTRVISSKRGSDSDDEIDIRPSKTKQNEDPFVTFYKEYKGKLAEQPKPLISAAPHTATVEVENAVASTDLPKKPMYQGSALVNGKIQMTGKTADGKRLQPAFTVYGKSEGSMCFGCGGMISKASSVKESKGLTGEVIPMTRGRIRALKNQNFLVQHKTLCDRCKQLKQLDEKTESVDIDKLHVVKSNPINAEIFAAHVNKIKNRVAWAIQVVDATDIDGSLIRAVRNIVGKNPLLLAVTKADMLPEDLGNHTVRDRIKYYIKERAKLKGLICTEVFIVSGLFNKGVEEMVEYVNGSLHGKDVYIFGNANVGKSTLVNAFVQQMLLRKTKFKGSQGKKRKGVLAMARTTTSNLPGTTLFSVRIPCFPSYKQALWDTPGLFPKRFDWFQGGSPLLPPRPDILTPRLLQWIPHKRSIQIVMHGIPIRLEIQEVNAAPKRNFYDLRKNRPIMVWYSKFDISPEVKAGNEISDADGATVDPTGDEPTELVLHKTVVPALDKRNCFSIDVVLADLGWLALSFDTSHEIKVFVPKAAIPFTTFRPVYFHPVYAKSQLAFIESDAGANRMSDYDIIRRKSSSDYMDTHFAAMNHMDKVKHKNSEDAADENVDNIDFEYFDDFFTDDHEDDD